MTSRILRRSIIAISCFGLLFKFGAGLHFTLLSSLGERLFPVWVVGIVIGAASLLQLVLDVPAGFLLDRFGYVRLLRVSTFVFLIGALVLAVGLTPTTFVLTILLGAAGWLFYGPGVNAYVLAESPRDHAGRSMGVLHALQSFGVVLATIVLPFAINQSPRLIGGVLALLLGAAWLFLFVVPRERASVHAAEHGPRHAYYIRRHAFHRVIGALRRLNPASTMLAVQSFAAAAFYGIIWFTIPIAIADGTAEHLPGVSLSVFDLAVVLLGSFFGRLADTWNKRTLVLAGLLIFSASGILLGFHFNLWFLLIGFIATAGDELATTSLWAWLDRLDTTHAEDGLVNGAIVFFEDLGWTAGPVIAGLLYASLGPGWVVTAGGFLLLASWLVALVMLRHPSAGHRGGAGMAPWRVRHKR